MISAVDTSRSTLALILISMMALSSCSEGQIETETGRENLANNLANVYPEWKPSRESDRGLRRRDFDPILHGIVREQYDNLDPFVARFDESYRCGTSVKEVFLSCFELYHRIGGSGAATYFPTYEKNLRVWMEMKPDSPVPILALAGLMKSQAWLSRGEDYAHSVTEEGWRGFEENLQRSRSFLENSPHFVRDDPHYWYQLLSIGLGQGVSLQEMNVLFREGQKRDPLYLPLYEQITWYLQPRWYGQSEKDWHEYLIKALEYGNMSDEERLMVYGVIVRYILRGSSDYLRNPAATFEAMGVNVPDFINGLAIYTKQNPDSSQWPIHYFYHADKAGNMEAMLEASDLADREFDSYNYNADKVFAIFEQAVRKFPELGKPLGRVP